MKVIVDVVQRIEVDIPYDADNLDATTYDGARAHDRAFEVADRLFREALHPRRMMLGTELKHGRCLATRVSEVYAVDDPAVAIR